MSNTALRSVYALTVLRLVNGVVDPSQKGRYVCAFASAALPPKRRTRESATIGASREVCVRESQRTDPSVPPVPSWNCVCVQVRGAGGRVGGGHGAS
jgi:hypothetical protein